MENRIDMTNDEETLAEVEARYKTAMLAKTVALEADIVAQANAVDAEKAKIAADKIEADKINEREEFEAAMAKKYNLQDTSEQSPDLNAGDTTKGIPEGKWESFHAQYLKGKAIDRVSYNQVALVTDELGFAFSDSDTGCDDDMSAWSPADVYCDLIWQAAQCGKQLSGIVTQRACDINAGNGLSVQIKTINASSMGSALSKCECASCSSNVFTTHTLTLARYDIYKVLCELDVFDVGDSVKAAIIESMSRAFISGIDSLIWTAMSGATPGYTETSEVSLSCNPAAPSTECCMYGAQLYKEVIELEAQMRNAGYGSKGFFLILNPRVATYLKYKEGGTMPPWANEIEMEGNTLVKIGNIKVIEYCGANSCDDFALGGVAAVMVDPERAIGEAYGKRPHLLTDKDPIECDSTKLVMRSYLAIGALDTGAIGHVVNP